MAGLPDVVKFKTVVIDEQRIGLVVAAIGAQPIGEPHQWAVIHRIGSAEWSIGQLVKTAHGWELLDVQVQQDEWQAFASALLKCAIGTAHGCQEIGKRVRDQIMLPFGGEEVQATLRVPGGEAVTFTPDMVDRIAGGAKRLRDEDLRGAIRGEIEKAGFASTGMDDHGTERFEQVDTETGEVLGDGGGARGAA